MYVRTGMSGIRGMSGGDPVITALSQINQAAYNYAYQQFINQGIDPASAKQAAVQAAYALTLQKTHLEPFVEESYNKGGGSIDQPGNPITSTDLAWAAQQANWPMCQQDASGNDIFPVGIPCRSHNNPDPMAAAMMPQSPTYTLPLPGSTTQLTGADQVQLAQYVPYAGTLSTGVANPSASYNPAQGSATSLASMMQLPAGAPAPNPIPAAWTTPQPAAVVQSSGGSPQSSQVSQPGTAPTAVYSTIAYDTQQPTAQSGVYTMQSPYTPSASPSAGGAPVASSTAVSSTGSSSTTSTGPLDSVMAWVSANPLMVAGGALALFFLAGGMGGKR